MIQSPVKRIVIFTLIAVFLAGCGAKPTPAPTPDIASTAASLAQVMVAQTVAAMPSQTPLPTFTLPPPTETPTLIPFPTTTVSPTVAASTPGSCNHPLSSWHGDSIDIFMVNETKEIVTLALTVTTKSGECGYLRGWTFKNTTSATVPAGCYYAFAYVGKKTTVSGSFCMPAGNWSVIVKNNRIVANGSCYIGAIGC